MTNPIKTLYQKYFPPSEAMPAGSIIQTTSSPKNPTVVVNSDVVAMREPYGTKVPQEIRGRASGWSQIQNLSNQVDLEKVQAALRAAERGDTTLLFGYYRDFFISTGIVAAEVSKRKLCVIAEPYSLLPIDKEDKDDVLAAKVIEDMIFNCPSWTDSLSHLLNSIIYPVAVSEKIFRPTDSNDENPYGLRYYLKELYPVDFMLLNYRLPYLPQGPISAQNNMPLSPVPPVGQDWRFTGIQSTSGRPEDTIYDLDSWEPDLRLWHVFNNGLIDYSWSNIYAPDPERHIVYRSNLLRGMARDNFGGLGRAILFWAIMSQLGRGTFLNLINKYGVPFTVVHADTAQTDTMTMLQQAFDNQSILNALVVNKDALVDIKEIDMAGAADGAEKFLQFCNDQVSLLISGITLGSHAKSTGLGSGVANLQSEVRHDIMQYDRMSLGNLLRNQLFTQFLRINGIKGRPPKIVFGGDSATSVKDLSESLSNLYKAGIVPTDDSLITISEKVGFNVKQMSVGEVPNKDQKQPVEDEPNTAKDKSDSTE